jgi:hypothetical protein
VTAEPPFLAACLIVAGASAFRVLRRRTVLRLGRDGGAYAPAALLATWLTGVTLGEHGGSLATMALGGAVALLAVDGLTRRDGRRRFRGEALDAWTAAAVGFVVVTVVLNGRYDTDCHDAVMGAYLRGNIPPTALNDASFPLPYHRLFDAVAALLLRALPIDFELARDLTTTLAVLAMAPALVPLSSALLGTARARRLGRVFFLLAFGPSWIRFFATADPEQLHGKSTQAFVTTLLRRPTALGFALFVPALACLVAYARGQRRPTLALLAPIAFVTPLVGEELGFLIAAAALPLVATRRISLRACVALSAIGLVGAARSGVVRAVVTGDSPMAAPRLGLLFPPALPSWEVPAGLPFGGPALGALLVELGPVALATLGWALAARGRARRIAALPLLVGLVTSSLLRLDGWNRADLDRFLLYGTPVLFLMTASWLDVVAARAGVGLARGFERVLIVATIAGPIAHANWTALDHVRGFADWWRERPGQELRRALIAVGPRDPVLTDSGFADAVVQAGFVVVAPMTSSSVGSVDRDAFDRYLERHAWRARWLLLAKGDRRLDGLAPVAEVRGHVLARAPMGRQAPGIAER